jgi:hypothetical protein
MGKLTAQDHKKGGNWQSPLWVSLQNKTNLYLHQRFTVFKVEYFLYIIQIMLQYTPSFNKYVIH